MAATSTPQRRAVRTEPGAASGTTATAESRSNPLFMGSLAKCFQVLEALNTAGRPVGLTELAQLSGLDRSGVQRITHTLRELRYLRQDPATKAFRLSSRMLEFGHTVLATNQLRERAQPHLESLNRRTAETVNLMGRIGLATSGVVHLIIGLLAIQIAFGRGDEKADHHGAIDAWDVFEGDADRIALLERRGFARRPEVYAPRCTTCPRVPWAGSGPPRSRPRGSWSAGWPAKTTRPSGPLTSRS